MYTVAAPDEYLAITGAGVGTVKIVKKAWIWPLQKCMRFSVQPQDYSMDLQAMTKEKLQFLLPVVFTVGPDINQRGPNSDASDDVLRDDDDDNDGENRRRRPDHVGDALMKYAILVAGESAVANAASQRTKVAEIVKGIIEGETRVLVSSMTMEEIFSERDTFKRRIFRNIQGELDQFGLKIYNANVRELRDAPGSEYFKSLSRKVHEGATNQARVHVADAQLHGNVGEADRRGRQEREIAKINAQTAVEKTERDIERAAAEATLSTRQTDLSRDVEISRIEAARATEARDEDLKRSVQLKRAAAEVERLRATDVVQATIARESKQQAADASAYEVTAKAKAQLEQTCKLVDGEAYKVRVVAEAHRAAAEMDAQAALIQKKNEAEGIEAMASAYAKMASAFGGPAGLLQYMMVQNGTYVELAKANATAIRGLNPKISVWTTGDGGSAGSGPRPEGQDSAAAMRNVYQMLPPLMTTINEQTGIKLPEWQFGTMANQMTEIQKANGASQK